MVVNRRKKFSRQRASFTHGWGSKKKHRGAGNRGGRGMAGTGKRGDAMKPLHWKDPKYFGKHGFKKKGVMEKIKFINLDAIGKFEKEGVVDLSKLDYNKLLGKGVGGKFKVIVKYASKNAVEKMKKVGGSVLLKRKTSDLPTRHTTKSSVPPRTEEGLEKN